MGVPTSEVGYTPAMPRMVDHEAHKDMWWHWGKKKISAACRYTGTTVQGTQIRSHKSNHE